MASATPIFTLANDPSRATTGVSPCADRADELAGFRDYRLTGSRRIRDELVLRHLGLAVAMARRYADRGLDHDDLKQVATIGLMASVERFDPERGVAFSSFAVPTILGGLKRHFRDLGWTVRVPRRLQDLRRSALATRERLQHELGATPDCSAIAEELHEDVADVRAALGDLTSCYRPHFLDERQWCDLPDDEGSTERDACTRVMAERLLEGLDARERRIFVLRYYEAMTQQEVADRVGLSQMHVSRLLRAGLQEMREAA